MNVKNWHVVYRAADGSTQVARRAANGDREKAKTSIATALGVPRKNITSLVAVRPQSDYKVVA